MKSRITLGTRGSELALRQAEMVEAALRAAHPQLHVERKVITTTGDKRTDLRFSEFAANAHVDKGIFVKELEVALESGGIIAYPTDTAYGLGCDIFNKKAVDGTEQAASCRFR